jgi:G6PDH family F420-dependent oxidoreductase
MKIGFKLFTEAFSPREIVEQAVAAEAAGFDFVEISDHYHPWLYSHGHSGFVWSMLASIAERTERLGLMTGVTCPIIRYHPAIVAQAAATTGVLSEGRFTLGVGAGERLNEHVVGQGWPAVTQRHEMLGEALEIIKLLWDGGYQSFEGKHFALEDARVFDLPGEPVEIAVAISGEASAKVAAEHGDAIMAVDPDEDAVKAWEDAGGSGARYCEVALAWAPDEDAAVKSAHELMSFGQMGWKVMAELPNPINFEATAEFVTEDHIRDAIACGPDVSKHVEAVKEFTDAGFDHLVLHNSGPDMPGFFEFFASELAEQVRALAPAD